MVSLRAFGRVLAGLLVSGFGGGRRELALPFAILLLYLVVATKALGDAQLAVVVGQELEVRTLLGSERLAWPAITRLNRGGIIVHRVRHVGLEYTTDSGRVRRLILNSPFDRCGELLAAIEARLRQS